MASSRRFHLGDVLSITTGYLVAPERMSAVYRLLNYMTGDNLFTHQLPRAAKECAPHLLRQHPALDSPEFRAAVDNLKAALDVIEGKDALGRCVDEWVAGVAVLLGLGADPTLSVAPIPRDAHQRIDPLTELVEMTGDPSKIIVVQAP